jgi:hypothetical protein
MKVNWRFSRKKGFIASTAFVLFCCGNPEKNADSDQILQDAEYSVYVKDDFDLAKLLSLESIIPLELHEGSFFTNPYRLIVLGDTLFMLDPVFGTLLGFNSDGKMLRKYGTFGSGPEEMADISDFGFDPLAKQLVLSSIEERSLAYFDLAGNFIRKIRLKNQSDMIAVDKNGLVARSITYFNEDFSNLELVSNSGDQVGLHFPFPQEIFPIILKNISGHLTLSSNSKFLFQEPASSIVYEVDGFKATPKFNFGSSDDMWPLQKKHDLNGFFTKVASGAISHPTQYFEENDDYLVFGWNRKKRAAAESIVDFRIGIFDKSTGTTFLTKPDDLVQSIRGPMAVKNDLFYFVIQQDQLLRFANHSFFKNFENLIQSIENNKKDHDLPVVLTLRISNLITKN